MVPQRQISSQARMTNTVAKLLADIEKIRQRPDLLETVKANEIRRRETHIDAILEDLESNRENVPSPMMGAEIIDHWVPVPIATPLPRVSEGPELRVEIVSTEGSGSASSSRDEKEKKEVQVVSNTKGSLRVPPVPPRPLSPLAVVLEKDLAYDKAQLQAAIDASLASSGVQPSCMDIKERKELKEVQVVSSSEGSLSVPKAPPPPLRYEEDLELSEAMALSRIYYAEEESRRKVACLEAEKRRLEAEYLDLQRQQRSRSTTSGPHAESPQPNAVLIAFGNDQQSAEAKTKKETETTTQTVSKANGPTP